MFTSSVEGGDVGGGVLSGCPVQARGSQNLESPDCASGAEKGAGGFSCCPWDILGPGQGQGWDRFYGEAGEGVE